MRKVKSIFLINFLDENLKKFYFFMKEYRIKDFSENKNYLDRIRINTIKLFIDGVFESGTALISTCIKYYLLI